MVPFIDIHCHLDFPDILKDLDNIIARAKVANVKVVTSGINPESIRQSIDISEKYDNVSLMVGIYPTHTVELVNEGKFDSELKFIKKNKKKIIGIGEIGLDYQEDSNKETQQKCFRAQIELAKKLNVPVLIHSRKAELDCIEILEEMQMKKVIMHCFCGKKSLVKRAADNGWYFTIPTKVTRMEQFQILVKEININQLFAETDSPFMSPVAETVNEPANVVESYKMIAKLKGFEIEHVRENLFLNYRNLFG